MQVHVQSGSLLAGRADSAPFILNLACVACRSGLHVDLETARCPTCGASYPRVNGIWRCLPASRAAVFDAFEQQYRTVRRAEGWGAHDVAYYRGLPWRDLTGRFPNVWRIRARSFSILLERVVLPAEQRRGRPLRVLDLGAGNCWLAYQLARRGHAVAAIDIQADALDGLGAYRAYDAEFTPIQAEFDRLPLADEQADLVVFNGALHYSTDYEVTLREALRVLEPSGALAIVDSPMYSDPSSGARMVAEREARFRTAYGFASDALPSEHYLSPARLRTLGAKLGLRFDIVAPWYWAVRGWLAHMTGRRELARFPVIIGTPV